VYGNTEQIRHRATELRSVATDLRDQAGVMMRAADADWVSTAAAKYAEEARLKAVRLGSLADDADAAAQALDDHAASVDAIKRSIEEAADWLTDRWNDASNLVGNTVETLKDGAGKVFEFFGREVPDALVTQAKNLVGGVPRLPEPGSVEWLDAVALTKRNGWAE
jgi:methyl-accepting chemotaxis protein